MALTIERAPGVPSRVEDEVLRQHPELRDGQRLILRLNGCTTGPVYAGMLLPPVPEGSRLKLSDRTFGGEVDGFGYLIRCWQEDKP